MKILFYSDIKLNNKAIAAMAYNAARRALLRLEHCLHKTYGVHIPFLILKELLKIRQKLNQMAARYKNAKIF